LTDISILKHLAIRQSPAQSGKDIVLDRTKRLYYSKIPNLPDERNCNVALAEMEKRPQAYAHGPFIYPVNPVFRSPLGDG